LVVGASALAGRLGISALVIGLTIVAFGTSAPELVVNLLASLSGNTDLAIGNVVGSNIANILLILGLSATVYPLAVKSTTLWKEIPFALLAVVMLFLLANDAMIDGEAASVLTRIDGLVLIGFFIIFLYYIIGLAKSGSSEVEDVPDMSISKASFYTVLGIAGLVIGGKWIVDGAIAIASSLGVSETLIGLTVVAIGTSLPEMATSVVAAYKKNVDIAIGNVVGSNIFNVFWILGISSFINPLPFSPALNFDLTVTIGVTLVLFLTLFIGRRHQIERWQGVTFVVIYVMYIIFLVLRG
jgi:cation:H+ antiporter